uniref:Gustatory receptor n=1 Tax=Panagrolaimus sp. JU765 TaxID=591449 RepID=A0AC34PXA8_9BILA
MNENEINDPSTPLLRRRYVPSRENSVEDVKPRILKLDLESRQLKRKDSNVDLTEELKVIVDEVEGREHKEDDKVEDGLLAVKKTTLWGLIASELTRGYSLQNDEERFIEKRRKVYAFLYVFIELEKFLFYGFLQCLDAFCYVFTILPIRCILAFFQCIFRMRSWTHANTCDFLKIFIIISASTMMHFIDTSRIYHLVRGQGIIKLYIVYNMLEVADKLFSSFGQDILDALMWTATENGKKPKYFSTFLHLLATIAYAFSHAFLVLLQATTLNVAFNSQSQSLLTILISNNFVELKGSVFKKFAKPNLFQMSCSDVRERI